MIETTLGRLVEGYPALDRLASQKLPIKAAYTVSKLLRLSRPEIEHYEQIRNDLIKKFGYEREATEEEAAITNEKMVWEVLPQHRTEFFEAITEARNIPITIDWNPLHLTAVTFEVTAVDLIALGPFLLEDLDTKDA
jgi:hypothetical protein